MRGQFYLTKLSTATSTYRGWYINEIGVTGRQWNDTDMTKQQYSDRNPSSATLPTTDLQWGIFKGKRSRFVS